MMLLIQRCFHVIRFIVNNVHLFVVLADWQSGKEMMQGKGYYAAQETKAVVVAL